MYIHIYFSSSKDTAITDLEQKKDQNICETILKRIYLIPNNYLAKNSHYTI